MSPASAARGPGQAVCGGTGATCSRSRTGTPRTRPASSRRPGATVAAARCSCCSGCSRRAVRLDIGRSTKWRTGGPLRGRTVKVCARVWKRRSGWQTVWVRCVERKFVTVASSRQCHLSPIEVKRRRSQELAREKVLCAMSSQQPSVYPATSKVRSEEGVVCPSSTMSSRDCRMKKQPSR